jgi:hypothetical protein
VERLVAKHDEALAAIKDICADICDGGGDHMGAARELCGLMNIDIT